MEFEIVAAYAIQGLLLGLQGGLHPGPFTTLVISESFKHGRGAGLRCSTAPLISDPPIVICSFLVLSGVSGMPWIIRAIAMIGGTLLAWLAWTSFRVRPEEFTGTVAEGKTLLKAVGVNLLNPNPYIYWFTIAGPLILKAAKTSVGAAIGFVVLFYVGLVGVKGALAIVAGGARHRLNASALVWANRIVGAAMLLFAAKLFAIGIWGIDLEMPIE